MEIPIMEYDHPRYLCIYIYVYICIYLYIYGVVSPAIINLLGIWKLLKCDLWANV